MLKKIYYLLYRLLAAPGEKGSRMGGVIQGMVRKEALGWIDPQAEKILELGCADGLFLARLAQERASSQVWGIDINQQLLSKANDIKKERSLTNMNVLYQDARNLDFNQDYFDAVICINFMHMLKNLDSIEEILSQMKRVCKRGGSIVFEFRNSLNLLFLLKYKLAKYYDGTVKNQYLNSYRFSQIRGLLERLDLETVRIKHMGFPYNWLSPIIMIEARKR